MCASVLAFKATGFYLCVCLNYKSVCLMEARYRVIFRTFLESDRGSFTPL